MLPLDQVKFLCIFGICGCSQGTSHCRALKTSPASFQPRFILFLNSGNAEQGDGLIKNQRIGSIFLVKQDRYSCLGNLHSLHNWFSFEMRMKVWSWRSSPKPPLVSHQPDWRMSLRTEQPLLKLSIASIPRSTKRSWEGNLLFSKDYSQILVKTMKWAQRNMTLNLYCIFHVSF